MGDAHRARAYPHTALTILLLLTALATASVEALNWLFSDDAGFALFVRTGWAVLRSLGFLVLIWHVRRDKLYFQQRVPSDRFAPEATRARSRLRLKRVEVWPFALVLTVTTVFALARLVIPREGRPHPVGIAGFAVVTVLCLIVLRLVWRPGVTTRQVTVRVAAFSYSPLMLVAAMVALGPVFGGRVEALPAVIIWFLAGITVSYVVLFVAFFQRRGRPWTRTAYVLITLPVLAIHVPFTWWLLGTDGLLRDAAPLVVAAIVVLIGSPVPRSPAEPSARRPPQT